MNLFVIIQENLMPVSSIFINIFSMLINLLSKLGPSLL